MDPLDTEDTKSWTLGHSGQGEVRTGVCLCLSRIISLQDDIEYDDGNDGDDHVQS